MRYLSLSELIYINGTLLNNPHITSGKRHVRDIDLLEAAVQRPAASAFDLPAIQAVSVKQNDRVSVGPLQGAA